MSLNGSQPNFSRCLAVSWVGRLFIHFRRLLPHNAILQGAKSTLRPPSLALSHIGSVTARHSSSGRDPNFAALSSRRHLYSAGRPSRWALAHIVVLVYINDLPSRVRSTLRMSADDCLLYRLINTSMQDTNIFQSDLDQLQEWESD